VVDVYCLLRAKTRGHAHTSIIARCVALESIDYELLL